MRPAPAPSTALPASTACPAVLALDVQDFRCDTQRVAIPQVEAQVVVRFGPTLPGGVDVHALGPRTQVQRKFIRGGQRAVLARLQPGMYEAALGASAGELGSHPIPLDALWGMAETTQLQERLAHVRDGQDAAALLVRAISARALGHEGPVAAPAWLAVALDRLRSASVAAVARELGISERHLRRQLRAAVGIGPKTYARLKRFGLAIELARHARSANWSAIAAEAGYYDQSHLIADFQAIASSTPARLLDELRVTTPGEPTAA